MALDTIKRLAEAYPGGVAALAQRLGKHPGTLYNELCPREGSSAKLGLADALSVMDFARQARMAEALAPLDLIELRYGRMAIPLPTGEELDDECLLRAVSAVALEFGQFAAEVATSAADGRISDNELKRVRHEAAELSAALQRVLLRLAELNAASKPREFTEVDHAPAR